MIWMEHDDSIKCCLQLDYKKTMKPCFYLILCMWQWYLTNYESSYLQMSIWIWRLLKGKKQLLFLFLSYSKTFFSEYVQEIKLALGQKRVLRKRFYAWLILKKTSSIAFILYGTSLKGFCLNFSLVQKQ